jgi:tRNA pseudouridine38-40 synthase
MLMRLRIDLAYDGGNFHGWAKQPALRTVQGEMETALHRILDVPDDDLQEPLRLVVAGRTDTGVHASHQVCHLDVQVETLAGCIGHMDMPAIEALMRRLRHFLPDDITIHAISEAPEGFDARFSALERTYVFRIADGAYAPDPRLRGFVLSMDGELDTDAMNQASAMMLGLHDFGSFATPNPGGTTIREVKTACWRRVITRPLIDEEARGHYCTPAIESGLVCFTIVADAFAHNMVRSLVGACVQVGLGKRSLDWFAGKMAQPVREGSTGPIAPHGLTLEHIAYPPDKELGVRAERIRARRTLP